MKIRITGHGGEGRFPFGQSGPWSDFERQVLINGHEICGLSYDEDADAIISNSFNSEIEQYMRKSQISQERRILVLWEPYIVERARYLQSVTSQFGTIFAPSVDWAERVNGRAFKWPQDEFDDDDVFNNWQKRKKSAVMIQGNKFSARKGELYGLRRRVLREFSDSQLSLYGTNWNSGIGLDLRHWLSSFFGSMPKDISITSAYGLGRSYSKYQGMALDKIKELRKYKISIVIENSADFVSEKLFDSIRAGCATIYVGPNLARYGIPDSSAICSKPNFREISRDLNYLLQASDKDLETIAIQQYDSLKSISHLWRNSSVLANLAREMLWILESGDLIAK